MPDVKWDPPGPGVWSTDRSHFDRPLTGFGRRTAIGGAFEGQLAGARLVGGPGGGGTTALVNGWVYGQRRTVAAEELPEREDTARAFIENRRWREIVDHWFGVKGPASVAACLAIQEEAPEALSDSDLINHLHRAIDRYSSAMFDHHSQGALFFVVGELLVACERWGMSGSEALELLAGASPATSAAARQAGAVADALRDVGCRPATLEDVSSASDAARAALNDYLRLYGWRVVTSFDFDGRALREMPEVVLRSILGALDRPPELATAGRAIAGARAKLPEADRARFDELLAEARLVYGLRDDDVGPVVWSRGLVRRCLLEIGQRLSARDALADARLAFEAAPDQLVAFLGGDVSAEASDALASQEKLRAEQATLEPPNNIGEPFPAAALDLPPTVARIGLAAAAYAHAMVSSRPPTDRSTRGFGIGDAIYRGRARVALRVEDALARIEPGDVLITSTTTPAFNAVLAIAGAIVTQEGGLISHAAIMARELCVPAVVGASGVLNAVPDGAEVELDPTAGTVRIVSTRTP